MFAMPITLVAFDLETTGLSSSKDDIIEVGAVKFQLVNKGKGLEVVEKGVFESFVKPDRLIPPDATRVNHITNEMVENAPSAKEVLPTFLRFCGQSSVLVAHNGHSFDGPFLAKVLARNGLPVPKLPILDSLKLSRNFMPESGSHKLGEIASRFIAAGEITMNLNPADLHRALYDCRVLAEVTARLLVRAIPEKDLALDKFAKALDRAKPGLLSQLSA